MAETVNYHFIKPTVSGDTGTWGQELNQNLAQATNLTTVDSLLKDIADKIAVANQNAFYAGMIIMWSGSLNTIPEGWVLCNGQNNTPDLQDRFIIGAGNTYQALVNGGSSQTTTTPVHTHTVQSAGGHTHGGLVATTLTLDQMPAHSHSGNLNHSHSVLIGGHAYWVSPSTTTTAMSISGSGNNTSVAVSIANYEGGSQSHTHSLTPQPAHTHEIDTTGSHSHSFSVYWYALAYLMKT